MLQRIGVFRCLHSNVYCEQILLMANDGEMSCDHVIIAADSSWHYFSVMDMLNISVYEKAKDDLY